MVQELLSLVFFHKHKTKIKCSVCVQQQQQQQKWVSKKGEVEVKLLTKCLDSCKR